MPSKDRYEIVVVGAGPLGLATAYHLARQRPGRSLLVVDALAGPGEGSMGASNSMVRDVFSSRDNRKLAGASIGFYRHLMESDEALREPVPLLDLYGYLWLLPEPERAEYARLLGEGPASIDARPVDLETLAGLPGLATAPPRWFEGDHGGRPPAITGGLFGRCCGAVAPELLARYYHDEAQRLGVEFSFGSCVQKLSFEGREEILLHDETQRPFAFQEHVRDRLRISEVRFGDGGSVRADQVVVAAGAWSGRILDALGFATACSPRPQGTYSVAGPAVDALLDWRPDLEPIARDHGRARLPFVILPTGATLKPVFRQRRLWLGCLDTVSRPIGTLEDPSREGRLEFQMGRLVERSSYATDLLPAISPYLPRFETAEVRLDRCWGGYYNFSPDGLPIIANEPYGVVFVGGDSGSGIMKADSLGRLTAAACDGASEGTLFSGESYPVERLSLVRRDVEPERIIL